MRYILVEDRFHLLPDCMSETATEIWSGGGSLKVKELYLLHHGTFEHVQNQLWQIEVNWRHLARTKRVIFVLDSKVLVQRWLVSEGHRVANLTVAR